MSTDPVDAFLAIVAEVRAHYLEDIFPPPTPRTLNEGGYISPDRYSAAGARIACDEIARLARPGSPPEEGG